MPIPPSPQNVVADPTNSSVALTWNHVSAMPPVTNYIVEYSLDQEEWTAFEAPESADSTRTVNPIENNRPYFFRVFAINSDGTGPPSATVTSTPVLEPKLEYCSVADVADWLRIDVNANTDPNTRMIENLILFNQERIDRLTAHSWQSEKQYRHEVFDLTRIWRYGRGMPLFTKHRQIKLPLDKSKGDMVEVWNGLTWEDLTDDFNNSILNFEPATGVMYIRGYFFSIFDTARFRLTYRYGSDQEGLPIPLDIRKACILMTSIDLLSTDFKMSQIAYGGEGNVNKSDMIKKWQDEIDNIIWSHSEITTVYD